MNKSNINCPECGSTNLKFTLLGPDGKRKLHCQKCNTWEILTNEMEEIYQKQEKLKSNQTRKILGKVGQTL